jgi:hypothetical protein
MSHVSAPVGLACPEHYHSTRRCRTPPPPIGHKPWTEQCGCRGASPKTDGLVGDIPGATRRSRSKRLFHGWLSAQNYRPAFSQSLSLGDSTISRNCFGLTAFLFRLHSRLSNLSTPPSPWCISSPAAYRYSRIHPKETVFVPAAKLRRHGRLFSHGVASMLCGITRW